MKLCKKFYEIKFNIKLVFTSFKIKYFFDIKTLFLAISNLSWYINLLALVVVLATLTKYVISLKPGLGAYTKR